MEIKKANCKHCGKEFISLYEKQLEYNLAAHELSCVKLKHKTQENVTKILEDLKNGN